MNRSIDQWRGCVPSSMAKQSDAAIIFAFEDAKHDILELAKENKRLRSMLKIAAYPRLGDELEQLEAGL
jgi:hypothetical protein